MTSLNPKRTEGTVANEPFVALHVQGNARMTVTLRTIAADCDVDVSTVSRALRGDPRVKSATRDRIRATANRLGYRPNLAARQLRSGTTKTIWFVVSNLENPSQRGPARFADEYCVERGYDLLIAVNHGDGFQRLSQRLEQRAADGAIIVPSPEDDPTGYLELEERGFPMVFLDRDLANVNIPVVTSSNRSAAATLVEMCLNEGAEEFVLRFGDVNSAGRERLVGAKEALRKRNLPWRILRSDEKLAFDEGGGPLAVLSCVSEGNALAAMGGRRSRRRLIFANFDHWNGPLPPGVKVFVCAQDFNVMAKRAVDLLVGLIENPSAKPRKKTIEVPPIRFDTLSNPY